MPHRTLLASMLVPALIAGCSSPSANPSYTEAGTAGSSDRILAAFDGPSRTADDLSGRWRTVNDDIMGGRSSGGGVIRDGSLIFSGSTNTDGGGFSSVRAHDRWWDLTAFDGLSARVRADGRTYVFHIDTGLSYDNGNVFYRGRFETQRIVDPSGETTDEPWQRVFVGFDEFVPMVRGRAVTGRVEPLNPAKITGIGLMIDDGLDGPFRLEADWIAASKRPGPASAATTPAPARDPDAETDADSP